MGHGDRLYNPSSWEAGQDNKASMPENEKLIVISTLVSDLSGTVVSYHDLFHSYNFSKVDAVLGIELP